MTVNHHFRWPRSEDSNVDEELLGSIWKKMSPPTPGPDIDHQGEPE